MNSNEIIKKLDELKIKREKLKGELRDLDKMEDEYFTFLSISAMFDESLIQLISELLSIKEKESYVPFIYNSYSGIFVNGSYSVQNSCVGITKYDNIPIFSQSKNIEELFKQKYGYDMVCLNTKLLDKGEEDEKPYVGLYNIRKDYSKKVFTFEFLLNEIGSSAATYPFRVCKSDFDDCDYVQNYIKYLFDLQTQKNGKSLNYEEMKTAMGDYLEMEKGKTKIKKLS